MGKAKTELFAKRKNRAVAVAGVLDAVLDSSQLSKQTQYAGVLRELQRRWRQLCPMLGAQTWPLSLGPGGSLRVAASSSSVANELKYQAPTLMDAANLLAGYALVQKISVAVQPLPAPSAQPQAADSAPAPSAQAIAAAKSLCEGVADDGLREALTRLGSRIIQEKKS